MLCRMLVGKVIVVVTSDARAQPRSLVILIIKVCDIQIFERTSEISQGDNHSTTSAPCSSGTYNRLWAAAGRLPMI
jgi:hypothetical protein